MYINNFYSSLKFKYSIYFTVKIVHSLLAFYLFPFAVHYTIFLH